MSNVQKLVGIVVNNTRNKTIKVIVSRMISHPRTGKYIVKKKHYHVHDENNTAQINDKVVIKYVKPISKTKSFCLSKILVLDKSHSQELV
jgi:small subunit ribosomal protein S17